MKEKMLACAVAHIRKLADAIENGKTELLEISSHTETDEKRQPTGVIELTLRLKPNK